jgi:two-component sensor histidine kinase
MDIDITERKLSEQSLQQSLKDKQALLMEVNHRVKNNLQVISSLLRLEGHRSQQKETKAVLAAMQGRIQSMALLHKLLYRSGTFASVDLGSYVQQVASQAFSAQSLSSSSVRLSLHVGSVQVGMDQAIAAGLLVNELISNCLKHAFPLDRSGEVLVVLKPVNADASRADPLWCLEVSDTGVGLPAHVDQLRKASLGLQLVNDLSEQIGGSLRTESLPGEGTRFTLIFAALAPLSLVMPL